MVQCALCHAWFHYMVGLQTGQNLGIPLHVAAGSGKVDLLNLLVDNGADVPIKDDDEVSE